MEINVSSSYMEVGPSLKAVPFYQGNWTLGYFFFVVFLLVFSVCMLASFIKTFHSIILCPLTMFNPFLPLPTSFQLSFFPTNSFSTLTSCIHVCVCAYGLHVSMQNLGSTYERKRVIICHSESGFFCLMLLSPIAFVFLQVPWSHSSFWLNKTVLWI